MHNVIKQLAAIWLDLAKPSKPISFSEGSKLSRG